MEVSDEEKIAQEERKSKILKLELENAKLFRELTQEKLEIAKNEEAMIKLNFSQSAENKEKQTHKGKFNEIYRTWLKIQYDIMTKKLDILQGLISKYGNDVEKSVRLSSAKALMEELKSESEKISKAWLEPCEEWQKTGKCAKRKDVEHLLKTHHARPCWNWIPPKLRGKNNHPGCTIKTCKFVHYE